MTPENALARVMQAFPHGLPEGISFDEALARLKAGRAPKVFPKNRDYAPVNKMGPQDERRRMAQERREKVIALVKRGWSEPQIAEMLGVSVPTIANDKSHLRTVGILPFSKQEKRPA